MLSAGIDKKLINGYGMPNQTAYRMMYMKNRVQFVLEKLAVSRNSDLPQKKRLSEQAYEHIVKQICFGELKPGDRIVEADMAKRLGISTAPLREAIQKLHIGGWIENVHILLITKTVITSKSCLLSEYASNVAHFTI